MDCKKYHLIPNYAGPLYLPYTPIKRNIWHVTCTSPVLYDALVGLGDARSMNVLANSAIRAIGKFPAAKLESAKIGELNTRYVVPVHDMPADRDPHPPRNLSAAFHFPVVQAPVHDD